MDTKAKGDKLEIAIFDLLSQKISEDRFFARRECCSIYNQKGYYSRDRESEIIFDVAIEIREPGATDYSILYLVECKNHRRKVTVGDLESFFAKVNQVGGARTKAVVASTSGFQEGALKFARSQGIGLLRYFNRDRVKWILQRSPSGWGLPSGQLGDAGAEISQALKDEDFQSRCFDWYCVAPSKATNSLDLFFASVAAYEATEEVSSALARVANSAKTFSPTVPYLEKDRIETIAADAHEQIQYERGAVNLDLICDWQLEERGLEYEYVPNPAESDSGGRLLGTFSAEPLKISVFKAQIPERERFTLAHELGHLLLGHAEYLLNEYTEESDLDQSEKIEFGTKDVARMEWQANHFASCLLMPAEALFKGFVYEAERLGIRDRGFGPLYVDEQRTNLSSFYTLTDRLRGTFDVSREAVRIRLIQLGLLNDARRTSKPIQSVLDFGNSRK